MQALIESELILKSLMLSAYDEVYLFDAATMNLLYASDSAQKKIGTELKKVEISVLESALGMHPQMLLSKVDPQKNKKPFYELSIQQSLPLSGVDHNQLRVMLIHSGQAEYILVTKSDTSPNEKVVMALSESESRFQAIVSNIPGLVFQMQMNQNGQLSFVYLSEGCDALLGMTEQELQEDAQLLFSIMNAKDRADLREKLVSTQQSSDRLDWEGRVWIDGWQDTKWVNLRATTTRLENGVYQWDGIMFNITQSKLEKQQIEQSRRDLEQLTAHMNHIKEQERISIAREIHDDLGGNLTAIKMGLASIAKQISTGQPVSLEQTSGLESIVNRTFEAVHRISGNLRPSILDLGIVDAIEWQLNQFKKQVGLECQFKTSQAEIVLSTEQSMALFRICQESLSNIAKYAKATLVTVVIELNNDDVHLTIIDNGIGIVDADKFKTNSFGLRGMQERVSALNGSLSIGTPESMTTGTVIKVIIPL